MQYNAELLHTSFVTHNVRQYVVTRPEDLSYEPGQGVEVAIDEKGWLKEGRPFTPTGLTDEPVLEFIIKSYPDRDGVTGQLHELEPGADLQLSESFGSIQWQGPGVFLAGGAGITPFLAILRDRAREDALGDSRLYFSNSTPADVIRERELRHLLGDNLHLTCTGESAPGYDDRRLDRAFLEDELETLDTNFYVCGPQAFVEGLTSELSEMGVDDGRIVVES
jgi:cytochrome-b5 reductase